MSLSVYTALLARQFVRRFVEPVAFDEHRDRRKWLHAFHGCSSRLPYCDMTKVRDDDGDTRWRIKKEGGGSALFKQ